MILAFKNIKEWCRRYSIRKAKKEAKSLAHKTGKKYLVLLSRNGWPEVIAKSDLKKKYRLRGLAWDSIALYIAFPHTSK